MPDYSIIDRPAVLNRIFYPSVSLQVICSITPKRLKYQRLKAEKTYYPELIFIYGKNS